MSLLLAVDLSDPIDELLAAGCSWAERLSTTLDLVYVDQYPYTVLDPGVQTILSAEWRRILEGRERRLRELLETVPSHLRGSVSVRIGRAADEIVEAGSEHDAIVVATHGRRGVAQAVLGSVAERVVRLSKVPVIVLPSVFVG